MTEKTYQKIKRITKQDRQHINSILDIALNPTSEKYNDKENWIKLLQHINIDSLYRSLSQILNAEFDYLPQQFIMNNPKLVEIKNNGRAITIIDVLTNSDTLFRFAPSPSGYLHIGHFVPLLLNILLRSISLHHGRKSKLILRIDDTNPNEDDFSSEIKKTLRNIMGDSFDDMVETRSSLLASKVIDLIDNSIMNTYDDRFYVDLSDQQIIKIQRNNKENSAYREISVIEQRVLWNKMKSGELINAVVRAKIDMQSDNGNLRDPVMLRYVKYVDKIIMMPTYDLVCPVLDSFDSIENSLLIAMRDCNYYDRLDQYIWIQNALKLKSTAIVTFTRVSFNNIILSKRKKKNS
jgi:glutamyl-tRNA synthetase